MDFQLVRARLRRPANNVGIAAAVVGFCGALAFAMLTQQIWADHGVNCVRYDDCRELRAASFVAAAQVTLALAGTSLIVFISAYRETVIGKFVWFAVIVGAASAVVGLTLLATDAPPVASEFVALGLAGLPWALLVAETANRPTHGTQGVGEVDRFWSTALGRTTVEDRDAYRMYVVVAASDLEAEVDRLVGLGASVVERGGSGVKMADPHGNEFAVRRE